MKNIILTLFIVLLAITTQAQKQSKLVADETNLVTLKTSFKIETSNLEIFKLMQAEFKSVITKYSVATKSDRKGSYELYTIPFKPENLSRVESFFQKINKPRSK